MICVSAFIFFLSAATGTDAWADCDPDKRAIGRTCGDLRDTPPFSGTVFHREPNGTERPITKVQFWRGTPGVEGSVDPDSLERVKVKVNRSGRFSIPVVLSFSDMTVYCGHKLIETRHSVDGAVFVLRAPGCTDLIVPFSAEWHDHPLYMTCGENEKPQ
jgi:hypothetical protein